MLSDTMSNAVEIDLGDLSVSADIVKSYCCGLSEDSLRYQTIGEALDRAAELYPDQDSVIFSHQNQRLSYKDLRQTVRTVAGNLLRMGLARLIRQKAPERLASVV